MTNPDDLGQVPERILNAYDGDRFGRDGARVIDLLAAHLRGTHQRAYDQVLPWRSPADAAVAWPPAFGDEGTDDLVAELDRAIAGSIRLHHPRYLGHQVPPPLPAAALAELVAATLNNGMAVYEMGPSATAMERAVIAWMVNVLGLPSGEGGAGGILTSGGSVGNLTALLAARQACAGFDAWSGDGRDAPPLAILCSTESHYSVSRAVRIMGWGDAGAIAVPTDARHRLDVDALDGAAAAASARGQRVIAIVAAASSTATGAFDPLEEIAAVASARRLWLHVDGAHGASLALSPRHRHLLRGIERADSVVWDAHKLLMMPALVTAVLFRDARAGYHAFAQEASYLFTGGRPDEVGGRDGEWWNVGLRTLECTKRMMAIELYATLRTHGVGLFRAVVERLVEVAGALAARVDGAPDFELAVAPEANIVCFRHRPARAASMSADELDRHQLRLRQRLVELGRFYLVTTRLPAGVYLRSAVMNPLTEARDLDDLLAHLRELAVGLT